MHLHLTLAILLCVFLSFISASPLEASSTPASKVEGSSSTKRSSSAAHGATHRPVVATNTKPHPVSTKKQPFVTNRPNPTPRPHVVGPGPQTHPSPSPSFIQPHQSTNETVAAIVFEVLGALAGFLLFLGLMRCLYNYHRTPRRDRIAAILHRHQLQREMEELERNPPERHRSLEPPPPPYLAPPVYPDDEHTPLSRPHSVSYADNQLPPNG